MKKYGKHAKADVMEFTVLTPNKPEINVKAFFKDMKDHSHSKVNITINGQPTLSRTGKQVDIHTKALAYAGNTRGPQGAGADGYQKP